EPHAGRDLHGAALARRGAARRAARAGAGTRRPPGRAAEHRAAL
ncbi:MAG: hypothetical protein AVDCRST_MAG67-1160, partial [uncultured Solirubrobacteraceae bacterium]